MKYVAEYVAEMSDADRVACMEGYDILEQTGMLGDHPLRDHASALIEKIGSEHSNIVMFMMSVANECARYYARMYLESSKKNQIALHSGEDFTPFSSRLRTLTENGQFQRVKLRIGTMIDVTYFANDDCSGFRDAEFDYCFDNDATSITSSEYDIVEIV